MSSACSLHQTVRFAFQLKARVLMSLATCERCNSSHESKILSGSRRSSHRTVSMIFAASDLEKPPRRRNAWQSSSVQATIRSPAQPLCLPQMRSATNWQSTPRLARRFLRKSLHRELRMADRDLLELLDAPEIAVQADRSSALPTSLFQQLGSSRATCSRRLGEHIVGRLNHA